MYFENSNTGAIVSMVTKRERKNSYNVSYSFTYEQEKTTTENAEETQN